MNGLELGFALEAAAVVARNSTAADVARLRAAKYALVDAMPREGLCLPRHAERPRWRTVDGRGAWVCGDCHPPPFSPERVEWSAAPEGGGWTFELARELVDAA